jgi:citrate synthase
MTDKAKETPTAPASTGLRGVVVGASTVSDVVGDKGELIYQGYNIHDLAKNSTFEEVAFLLWNKRLPKQAELDELKRSLGRSYAVPDEVITLLKKVPRDADPIDTLRTTVSALEFYDAGARDISTENSRKISIKLTAQFASLVAATDRIRNGKEPVAPLPDENIATNFLYMLKGERPSEHDAKTFRCVFDFARRSRTQRFDLYGSGCCRNAGERLCLGRRGYRSLVRSTTRRRKH